MTKIKAGKHGFNADYSQQCCYSLQVSQDNLDINGIFDDPKLIFEIEVKAPEDILENSLIVLDTNTLLLPYKIGKNSFSDIRSKLGELRKAKRLYIPAHVAREFAKQRPAKLVDTVKALNDIKSVNIQTGKTYPFLESADGYDEFINAERALAEAVKSRKDAIGKLVKSIHGSNLSDVVSAAYRDLFPDIIAPLDITADLKNEYKRRLDNRIPPGYEDEGKETNAMGDFLIWKTILKLGTEHKRDMIFVTGEKKTDWWVAQQLQPRFELVYEYYQASNGKAFAMLELADLLKLLKVRDNVVQEVEVAQASQSPERGKVNLTLVFRGNIFTTEQFYALQMDTPFDLMDKFQSLGMPEPFPLSVQLDNTGRNIRFSVTTPEPVRDYFEVTYKAVKEMMERRYPNHPFRLEVTNKDNY